MEQISPQPRPWFDTTRHPALKIGNLILPAYIVPIIISLLLPVWHRLLERTLRRNDQSFSTDQKKGSAADLENNDTRTETKEQSSQSRPFVRDVLLHMYYSGWVSRCVFDIGGIRDDCDGFTAPLCISQAIVIPIAAYWCGVPLLPPLLAATGWIGLAMQHPPGVLASVSIAILALPFACQDSRIRKQYWLGPELSGSLLIALVCNYYIPRDAAIRSVKVFNCELWPWLIFVLGLAKQLTLTSLQDSQSSTQSQSRPSNGADKPPLTFKEYLLLFRLSVGVCACICIPAALGAVISNFSFTCLGWRWILDGRAATPPWVFDAIFLGGFVFMIAWCIRPLLDDRIPEADDGMWIFFAYQLVSSALAMSWAVVTFNAVYVVFLGLSVVRGSN